MHGLWFGQSKDLEAFVATLTAVMSGPAPVPAASPAPKVIVEVKPKGLVPTQVKPRPTAQKPAAAPSPASTSSPKSYRDIAKPSEAPVPPAPVPVAAKPAQQAGVRVPVESLFATSASVSSAPAPVSVVLAPAVASLFATMAPVAPVPAAAPSAGASVDKLALKAALTALLEVRGPLSIPKLCD